MDNIKSFLIALGGLFLSFIAVYTKGRKDSTQKHKIEELKEENIKKDIIINATSSPRSERQKNKII